MEKISIKLFGVFQKYVPGGELELMIKQPMTPFELRVELSSHLNKLLGNFQDNSLLNESRFATEDSLLDDSEVVTAKKIALLPPVCGG